MAFIRLQRRNLVYCKQMGLVLGDHATDRIRTRHLSADIEDALNLVVSKAFHRGNSGRLEQG